MMALRTYAKFVLDPSATVTGVPWWVELFFRSTPITLLVDLVAFPVAALVLLYKGLPFGATIESIPHLILRRHENHLDKLHSEHTFAQARRDFAAAWTFVLWCIGISTRPPTTPDSWTMQITALSLIPSKVLSFRGRAGFARYRKHLDRFEALCAKHLVDASVVNPIYHWAGNIAIWASCLLLLYPFKDILINIVLWRDPLTTAWICVKAYVHQFFPVMLAFALTSIFLFIVQKLSECMCSFADWASPTSALVGISSSLAYGCFIRWFLTEEVSIEIWAISDASFGAVIVAWMAYSMMMSSDDFGDYLRRGVTRKEES